MHDADERSSLVASKDGQWLAVETDKQAQLWQVGTKNLIGTYPVRPRYLGPRTVFSVDDTQFATVTASGIELHQLPPSLIESKSEAW